MTNGPLPSFYWGDKNSFLYTFQCTSIPKNTAQTSFKILLEFIRNGRVPIGDMFKIEMFQ